MENVKKIIQYLDGDVSDSETLAVELKIADNKRLDRILELTKDINRIEKDKELRDFIEKTTILRNEYSSASTKNIKFNRYLLAASVLFIAGVFSIFYFNHSTNTNKIFSQYYSKYEISIATRSGGTDVNELTAAIQFYDNCQYKEALSRFNKILSNDKNNITALFFSGVSYMETQDYKNAELKLKTVLVHKDTAFAEHATWYLALCYIKTHDIQSAQSLINKIADSNSYYRIKAEELSQKLNNIRHK